MSQFDVYENTNRKSAEQFPFLMEVQSDVFESSTRSIYVPLVLSHTLNDPDNTLNFVFTIDDRNVRFFPLDIASAPRNVVGKKLGSLKQESDKVVAALDLLFARF